jgi:tetratricopeptide (TPR) repeat protein
VNAEQEAMDSLVTALEGQRFEDAAAEAQRFVERYPASGRLGQVLYIRGQALVSVGKPEEGIAILREMIAKYPKDENVPFATFYIAQGEYMKAYGPLAEYKIDFDRAVPLFERALASYREVARTRAGGAQLATRARLMAAQTLFDLRRREEALTEFREYLQKEPQGQYAGQALFQTGAILAELERNDEAKEVYGRLIKEFPGTPEAATAVDRLAELNLIGQPMPGIDVIRWVNRGLLADQWKGKVLVITFWNTWCPHCQHDMPKMDAIYRKIHSSDLVMLGITHNTKGQNNALVDHFVREKQLTFPIGIDNHGATTGRFAVGRIPATAIIDRDGIIRWRNSGALLDEALIQRFLKGRSRAAAPPARDEKPGIALTAKGGDIS